ncbi:MAG: adenylate/guanylate cyclase domain-containing protein [Betaproteobacteria bacterium]
MTAAMLGILFADVCGSTRIYETLGDAKARQLISRCIELMTQTAQKHGGALIKTIGDEVMCRFPGADQAAAAALEMQEAVARAAISEGGFNIAIHVGFHYGPVVIEGNDIFGDAVNLAARMVNLSKRDQVVTTGATVAALSPKWLKSARQIDRAAVRGKQSQVDIFELVWQEAESTRIAGKAWTLPAMGAPGRMVLRMGTHEVEVDETHPSVTVGRAEQSDFVLKGDLISRLHARIDYRNHRFSFTDQSTNGSWVTDANGKETLVRHDNHVLTGSGVISFGHMAVDGQLDLLHYRVD